MKLKLISLLILISLVTALVPAVYGAEHESVLSYGDISAYENAMEEIAEPSELPYAPEEEEKLYLAPSADAVYEADILFMIEKLVVEAILNGEKTIDIADHKIYPSDINLTKLKYFSPYISNGIDLKCWFIKDSYYSAIDIVCPMSQSEVTEYFAKIDRVISEISFLLDGADTDESKALLLHDYLAYTGEYDYDNLLNGTIPADSYRSAGILLNRKGVCQSYSYAFKYFMNREGIECHIVSSDAMNHAWNMIKLADSYYHIDITWDDPIRDKLGRVIHSHFLLSDSAISVPRGSSDKNHHDWDEPDIKCTDKRYDNAYWSYVNSFIYRVEDSVYYIDEVGIAKRNVQSGKESRLVSFGKWPSWNGNGYWVGEFSGLWYYGGVLYYNSESAIRAYNLNSGNDTAVYSPSVKDGYVYGSAVVGDTLYYVLKKDPNETGTILSVPIDTIVTKESITLDRTELSMAAGESVTLNVEVENAAGELSFTWKSDDTSVATVSKNGKVTAVDVGVTTVSVRTAAGSVAECTVTVTAPFVPDDPDNPDDPDGPVVPDYGVDSSEMFRDVKSTSWFKTAVDHAVAKGLMNGTSTDRFEPNAPMNRAMLVTVLWRMEGSPEPDTKTPFTDLKQAWYRDAVAWAYSREIVNGTTGTTFSPSKNITREQMAAILYRYSSYKGYDTSKQADVMSYPDGLRISPYAILSMAWANGTGLITGKPSDNVLMLAPRGNATRAEVATILMRYFKLYNL